MTDLAVPAADASDVPPGSTTSAPSDAGLALVHDPAHGLAVTVRRHLDNAPVPEWRVLAQQGGHPPFTGPDWLRAVHAHVGRGNRCSSASAATAGSSPSAPSRSSVARAPC